MEHWPYLVTDGADPPQVVKVDLDDLCADAVALLAAQRVLNELTSQLNQPLDIIRRLGSLGAIGSKPS